MVQQQMTDKYGDGVNERVGKDLVEEGERGVEGAVAAEGVGFAGDHPGEGLHVAEMSEGILHDDVG